ncbi:MAG TPA: wax ester/triacylglycerol synthase family O-acyltransferase [Anaeromyxobacter sp.]|nr:wax ester/triacylglycerol synthase family O-acyltransferase [Anaeromyxobacter sp.]
MAERMTGVDAAWLHMDRRENTADVVAMMTFESRVAPRTVRRMVEEKLLGHARFRQRVVPEGPLGAASWDEDPTFALGRHLEHRTLPRGGARALQAFTSAVATERLDPAHPLWHVFLVDGFGAGSAIVAKLHHCIADGFALVGLLLSLADELSREEGAPHRVPASRDLRPAGDLAGALRAAVVDPARALDLAGRGAAFASSLARMALLPPDRATVLRRPLSGRRRTAFSRPLPLGALRVRARELHVTVNDLLVAALAGALRTHLARAGEAVDAFDVRALVPVNLRDRLPAQLDGAMGNCFGLVFLELPIRAASPWERLARVRERMEALKRSPDAVVTYAVLDAIGHLPAALEFVVTEFFSRKASLVVTNVPGPRTRLHVAGHEVDRIMFSVPHPATLGLGVSILSYAGEVRVGARADVAVMRDPAAFVAGFGEEVAAL